jgi:hypothetical protein
LATKSRNHPPPGTEDVVRRADVLGPISVQPIDLGQLFSDTDHQRLGAELPQVTIRFREHLAEQPIFFAAHERCWCNLVLDIH